MSDQQGFEAAAAALRDTVAAYIDVAQRYAAGDPAITRRQFLGCRAVTMLVMEEFTERAEARADGRAYRAQRSAYRAAVSGRNSRSGGGRRVEKEEEEEE